MVELTEFYWDEQLVVYLVLKMAEQRVAPMVVSMVVKSVVEKVSTSVALLVPKLAEV